MNVVEHEWIFETSLGDYFGGIHDIMVAWLEFCDSVPPLERLNFYNTPVNCLHKKHKPPWNKPSKIYFVPSVGVLTLRLGFGSELLSPQFLR